MASKLPYMFLNGWLNFDKPAGMSSAAAVGKLRSLFQIKKVGHAGTLDPAATGILPIAFGEATKTISYLMEAQKEYAFTIKWGEATNSDDAQGEIIARSEKRPSEQEIKTALPDFIGTIAQTPPLISAIKVNGQRAYKKARAGEAFSLPARMVRVDDLRLIGVDNADEARFHIICGKGVYIRSIARDLAEKLGTYGHITALRRVRVGCFSENDALGLEKVIDLVHSAVGTDLTTPKARHALRVFGRSLLWPLLTGLDDIPALPVSKEEAEKIKNGQAVAVSQAAPSFIKDVADDVADNDTNHAEQSAGDEKAGLCVALIKKQSQQPDKPVAIGHINEGWFQPARVFNL